MSSNCWKEEGHDPFSAPHIYYGHSHTSGGGRQGRQRTYSQTHEYDGPPRNKFDHRPVRRASVDTFSHHRPRQFIINVQDTMDRLVSTEDTDGNYQITIEDGGPKVLSLGTANSGGYNRHDIRGTYALANLLQELTIAQDYGRRHIILDEARLTENPVARLHRLIKTSFWDGLTRRIDGSVIEIVTKDPKAERMPDPRPRIYVPKKAPEQLAYYQKVAKEYPDLNLDVVQLPEVIDAAFTKSINDRPGLLALAMEKCVDENGKEELRGWPFVVPGGRFNELYGWDSYMISLGLLQDGRAELAKSMVINFCFEIEHYGKILNANRSYYLSRSQPPFLTDMAIRVFNKIKHESNALDFLRTSILAAIKEYYTVWMAKPRYDPATGLSRYRPDGLGIPPETEPSHFDSTLRPYAEKHAMSIDEFIVAYNDGVVKEPALDEYFLHDRAVRESGHDTTYRLEGVCANLATIDLNSLLYKYETDIARLIHEYFGDRLVIPPEFSVPGIQELEKGAVATSASWDRRARRRKLLINKYLWNEPKGMYFDYDTVKKQQITYESATVFWAMWAGLASPHQASRLVKVALPKFEELGGLASGTECSRGPLGLDKPTRQWDYPYGWAPQQMLAWVGLERYGYHDDAKQLAYRWLFMITKAFVDYHGVVVEKYDVTRPTDPHRVDAEYGNQGLDFRGVAREGFGWVNASFQIGLTLLGSHAKRALGACIPPEAFFNATLADMELLMDEFGASPPVSPSNTDENPFNDGALLTPATAVLQDPFNKLNIVDVVTPAA
ncbi:hypothetical protein BDD12DRAFT_841957 [Trichophaea hybrida]|nr:hypothetical protein BDD12DRAFT_841957 [Trichophaea hybrida]